MKINIDLKEVYELLMKYSEEEPLLLRFILKLGESSSFAGIVNASFRRFTALDYPPKVKKLALTGQFDLPQNYQLKFEQTEDDPKGKYNLYRNGRLISKGLSWRMVTRILLDFNQVETLLDNLPEP